MSTLAETSNGEEAAAHLIMAASAEMIVDMLVDGTFNVAQALSALAEHVAQYRLRRARIDAPRSL
jgi:hypothetical protein